MPIPGLRGREEDKEAPDDRQGKKGRGNGGDRAK
tara:strand:- start:846 stop:947 length:102 start_codon:yes stop_codon:yes gene_type:complete